MSREDRSHAGEALPAMLSGLVEQVAKRTRLRRGERVEVAAELAAHFRDGLAAGRSAEQLAGEFGEPRRAARLIRRAAIAKRNPLDRAVGAVVLWGGVAIAAVALLWLGAALRVGLLQPTIAFDPFERYEAGLPKPDERGAALPVYLNNLAWLRGRAALADDREAPPEEAPEARSARQGRMDEAIADLLAAEMPVDLDGEAAGILRRRQREIAGLREAAGLKALGPRSFRPGEPRSELERRYYGFDPADSEGDPADAFVGALGILLPELSELRAAARVLAADARLAVSEGDTPRAVDDLLAMAQISRHASEGRTLVGQLVEASMLRLLADQVVAVMERSGDRFTIEDLGRLHAGLAEIGPDRLRLDLSSERMMFEDIVQRTFSDDGRGDGIFLTSAPFLRGLPSTVQTPSGELADPPQPSVLAWLAGPVGYAMPGRAETLSLHRRWVDLNAEDARREPWDHRRSVGAFEEAYLSQAPRARVSGGPTALLNLLLPGVDKARFNLADTRFAIEAARIAVALQAYRAAEGAWPPTLADLSRAFPALSIKDPFTAVPLAYEVASAGPRVWSTGPDGIDDGGRRFDSPHGPVRTAWLGRGPTLRTAVLLHRARTGGWPESIEALSAEDLAGVDPSGLAELDYELVNGVPTIRRQAPLPPAGDATFPEQRQRPLLQGDLLLVEWR